MEQERKTYGAIPKEEELIAFREGKNIFLHLKSKYKEENVSHYDIILNSLCSAIITMINLHVAQDDWDAALHLVYRTIHKNLVKDLDENN